VPDRPIRVLHLVESRDTSGFFRQLARFADRSRFEVSVATLKPIDAGFAEALRSDGVPHFSLGCASRISYPLGLLRLALRLRGRAIDVLHTHLFDPSVVGLAAGRLARTRTRVLTRHYSDYHTRIDKSLHVRLDRIATRLSHAVIAVSSHTAEHLVLAEGAPRPKVRTILNGVDFARLAASPPEVLTRLRAELAADGEPLLLMPARLHPEKGHTFLFQALEQLGEAAPLVLLAGDGPFRRAYEAEVAARGIQAHVRFLGFRQDLPDLMSLADGVVLPSVAEAFGLVLVEALYLGTPVVATRVGGVSEIVTDGVDGLLVPPGDAAALALAMRRLGGEPGLRSRLAGAGRARMEGSFDFRAMLRAYEALYLELLAAHA